jgi:hypothetical protein
MIILGGTVRFLLGTGISQIDSHSASILYFCYAEIGIIGEFLQIDPFINYLICL